VIFSGLWPFIAKLIDWFGNTSHTKAPWSCASSCSPRQTCYSSDIQRSVHFTHLTSLHLISTALNWTWYTVRCPVQFMRSDEVRWDEIVLWCTGWSKQLARFLYALTSSNINRFSKLFHWQSQEKICNYITTKDPTTPWVFTVCCYTTFWNVTEWGKLSHRFIDHAIGQWCCRFECVVRQQWEHIEHLM